MTSTPDTHEGPQAEVLAELERCSSELIAATQALLIDRVGAWTDATFSRLAVRLFHAQYAGVLVYRDWVDLELGSRGHEAADVRRWQDIPALPIAAFKRTRVAAHSPSDDLAVWESSTTTGAVPSRHFLRSLDAYDASLRAGSVLALVPDPPSLGGKADLPTVIQISPGSESLPTSSLGHMLDTIRLGLGNDGGVFASEDEIDTDGAWAQLAAATTPILLIGTSFALVHLLDATVNLPAIQLPARSRIMDTGGYKGKVADVDRAQLLSRIHQRLGVAPQWVENEYGMSELSSQAWTGSIAGSLGQSLPGMPPVKDGVGRWQPPWLRTRVVDPATLTEVADGEVGVLVHHDLANIWSCAAIRTEDLGRRRGARWEFAGRASGAELRGCSLRLEDLLL